MSSFIRSIIHFQVSCPETVTVVVKGPYGNETVLIPHGKNKDVTLDPGPYTVTATAPGYTTVVQSVQLHALFPMYLSLTLVKQVTGKPAAQTQFSVRVLDSKTAKEIQGASVWINGAAGLQTMLRSDTKEAVVSANVAGYKPKVITVPVKADSTSQMADIALDAVPIPDTLCSFLAASDEGASITAVPSVAVTLNGQTVVTDDTEGESATFSGVPAGTYTLTASKAGFLPFSQTITVGDTRAFTFQLTATEDEQSSPVAEPTDSTLIPLDASDIAASLDVAEDTYDNSAYQGYFTSAQCQLYIGNLFIDELVTVQYALQQNTIPVYGYCSEYADAWGRGRSLVQGQLVLNFVHQGYLYAALANAKKAASNALATDSLALQIARTAQASVNFQLGDAVVAQAKQQLTDLMAKASPDEIELANAFLRSAKRIGKDPYTTNPLALQQTFDMRLVIGDGAYQSVRLLENVKLTGNEQIVDARSGDVLAESYSFIARRLK
jgi:hypothetical protein